ncbi:SRPBCC family protein [Aeromicrobium sp. CnD17-E]|jgi:uncharacterized protein YndB with AHSA1/START domain|uniref:SRPBCC family protein n=1 Tax=Aeromicrobium sp. CnD17-E TaxID=2954487 RepID=UPI0020981C24|nr:SRPBCC family protein [Aeromicrobium sp. CnD17-E]MCO7238255.1 SRPBCC family protein [Aeromicrobium sp. CnD17-E]
MTSDQVTAERLIAAPSDRIFAILADAGRHQLIDGSGTVQGTKSRSEPLSMGSTFGMSMKMGLPYTTKNEVVEFEPNRRIAWRTTGLFGIIGGRTWRYELVDQGTSTIVRETWDISRDRQRIFLRRGNLPRTTKRNMERTLERLAEAVEQA